MKIELVVENRFGITQEVLVALTDHRLDLAAVEVIAEHIYLNVPALTPENFNQVRSSLTNIQGVKKIKEIDLLPDEQRRLHLNALLSTLPDPVFAVDAAGLILSANTAATHPLKQDETDIIGTPIETIVGGSKLALEAENPKKAPPQEVTLANQPYLLELKPIHSILPSTDNAKNTAQGQTITVGNMLILQAPTRLGHHISKVQMKGIEGFNAITGESKAIISVKERAQRFATIHAPLLIQGETGTGKELFARAVHQTGPWHEAAFLVLNCAALPENLVESELFGYASGAFTGANRGGKPGLLELADGGTAFLDEIGEISPYVQAKLLRFIQDGSFRRVGGKEERKVSVRVICATHRNLEQLVKEGKFREDLMYRLNVLNLTLPALRERSEDIPTLSDLFIAQAATQIGCPRPRLASKSKEVLTTYSWPGNVRQLENVLFRSVALSREKIIGPEELQLVDLGNNTHISNHEPENWKAAQAAFEKDLLTTFYKRYPSSRKLAKRFGVSHTTISDKLRAYNIRNS